MKSLGEKGFGNNRYSAFWIAVIALSLSKFNWAYPSNNDYRVVRQSDNSELVVAPYQDEHLQWLETPRGEIVLFNRKSGNYEYATIGEKNGEKYLKPSGVKVEKFVPTLEEKLAKQAAKENEPDGKFVPLMRNDIISLKKTLNGKSSSK